MIALVIIESSHFVFGPIGTLRMLPTVFQYVYLLMKKASRAISGLSRELKGLSTWRNYLHKMPTVVRGQAEVLLTKRNWA